MRRCPETLRKRSAKNKNRRIKFTKCLANDKNICYNVKDLIYPPYKEVNISHGKS